jgi:hypothetical protein
VRRATLTAIAALVALLALPATASAITKTWHGDVDNNWATPGNWSTNSVPTFGDTAVISSASDGSPNPNPTVSSGDQIAGEVQLEAFSGRTLTVSGGTLQVDDQDGESGQITAGPFTGVTVSGTGNLVFVSMLITPATSMTLSGGFIDGENFFSGGGGLFATAPTTVTNSGTRYGANTCVSFAGSSCTGGLSLQSNVSINQTADINMGGGSPGSTDRFLQILDGTYTLNGNPDLMASANAPTVFVGSGATLRKTGVGTDSEVAPALTVGNSGTVNGASGVLDVSNNLTNLSSGTLSGGNYTIDGGARLRLPDQITDLDADLSIAGNGELTDSDAVPNPGLANLGDIESNGTLTFTGNHTEATVLDDVNGTLALNGTSSLSNGAATETFINGGGLLTGTGTLDGEVFNQGTVAPGASPGLLTVAGNYSQSPDGQLDIEVEGTGDGEFDVLRVDGGAPGPPPGDVTLDGELALLPSAGYANSAQPGDAVSFLRYDGERVSGTEFDTPATVNPPLSGGKPFTASYDDPAKRVLAVVGEGPPPPPPPPPPPGDTAAPDTQITKGPAAKTKNRQAGFDFTSTEPGSTFNCAVDGQQAFRPCTSPTALKVSRGTHTFSVQATDAAGNVDPTPATYTWKVRKKKPKK